MLQAGKKVERWPLPARAHGQRETIWIGRSARGDDCESDADILNPPIPPAPVFTPHMDDVRAAAAVVPKAALPLGNSHGWHSQIGKCLDADEERARTQKESSYASSGTIPFFGSPFEKRRPRILNALFSLIRCGMHPHLSGNRCDFP